MKKLERRDLVMIGVAALVVRLCGALLSQRYMPVVAADTTVYMSIARSLHEGNGYALFGSPEEASRIPPLFPIWLSILMRCTGPAIPLPVIGVCNAIFRAGACLALTAVTSRYFGHTAAIGAALMYIIDPWEALWAGYVLKESLGVALLIGAIYLVARASDSQSPRDVFLAGAVIGLATLTRWANGAVWIAAVIVVLASAHPARDRLRGAVAISISMLAVLSPWLIRNWRVTGQPVLSPHFVGQKLYTSNGPGVQRVTDGYYAPRGVDSTLIRGTQAERSKPFERDASLGWLTIKHLAENPGELPARVWSKVVNTWRPTFEVHSRRNLILLAIPYCVLMVVSLIGIVIAAREHNSCPAIAVSLIVFLAIHLVFRGEIRNRQYLMPLFYAFGGLAIATAGSRSGART